MKDAGERPILLNMAVTRFDPALDTTIDCSPRAPSDARRAVDQLAAEVDAALLRDVQLLVSELVTNSVRHSGSGAAIRLRVWARPSGLEVEVADGGPGFAAAPARARDEAEGGRGLVIVDALAERWGVRSGPRTRVWFEVAHPAAAPIARAG